jgi:MFS family permease
LSSPAADPAEPVAPAIGPWTRRATLPVTLFVQAASSAAVIAPTVAAPLLLQRLQLGPAAVGVFIALVYLAAMFSSPLGAALVRHFGPIRSSQLALLASAAGLALLLVPWLPAVAVGALLVGVGYGPITPASSQMLARTTDPRHFSLVFSVKQTGVPLGGVIAGLLVPPLVVLGGVTAALLGVAALCLAGLLAALPLAAGLDRDRDRGAAWPSLWQLAAPVRFVAAHPVLRSVALCSFIFSIVQVSLTSYMVTYLTTDLRWTLVAAGAALAVSQTAGVVGRIVWGLVADRWLGARRMLLVLALAMAACGLLMPLLAPSTAALPVLVLLCAFGATAVGWNGVYLATVARLVPQAQAATATAGTLFFTFFGVVIGPPLFGAAGTAFGALGPAFALLGLPLLLALWSLGRGRWG